MKKTSIQTTERIKNKKFFGFSIAEMLLVLLVVSIILIAIAPMVTKRAPRERVERIFDILNIDPLNAVDYIKGRDQRIFMNARKDGYVGIRENGEVIPSDSLLFGYNTYDTESNPTKFVGLGFETKNAANSVAIGYGASAENDSIAIGYGAKRWSLYDPENGGKSVSIGSSAGSGTAGVAVGYNASATPASVAIGYEAKTLNGENSVAIGYNAIAIYDNSVAIGYKAKTSFPNTVVLGTENTTVYIPGNIVVDHAALIGRAGTRNDNLYFLPYAQEDGRHFATFSAGDWQGDDSNLVIVRDMTYSNRPRVKVGPYTTTGLDKWYNKKTFMGITTQSKYDDNNYVYIDFDDPDRSPKVCASKHEDRGCKAHGSGKVGAQHFGILSDIRLKNVGETFKGSLAELDKLNLYHFTFKDDENKTPQVGVMAQNLQEIFPNAVTKNKDGYLQIRWDEMFYSVINAIKELNTKIAAIDERLQQIAQDVIGLKDQVEKRQITIDEREQFLLDRQAKFDNLAERIEKLEHIKK